MKLFGWNTNNISVGFDSVGSPNKTNRDWRILLFTALVLLIVSVGFSAWFFIQVDTGNFASANTDLSGGESVTLDRERLNQAVADFRKKRATYELLRDRQPEIPNPAR